MHIPVILCGLICGWQYGLVVGFILPFLRYVMFGMPLLFPTGIAMAFELATYGMAVGLFYSRSRWQCVISLYRSMAGAMVAGRLVWAVVQMFLLGTGNGGFTLQMFMAGAFLNAIPGIILQLVLVPAVMVALNRTGLVQFTRRKTEMQAAGLVSESFYSKVERGVHEINAELLIKILEAHNFDVIAFFQRVIKPVNSYFDIESKIIIAKNTKNLAMLDKIKKDLKNGGYSTPLLA